MRRSWPVLFATIIFLCGTALAAGPAAAAGGPSGAMVLPGGPAGRMTGLPQQGPADVTAQTVVASTNWAGYAATGTGGQFTSVSASWVQSAATCSNGDQYSAFWVGLDGYSSSTVEQTGTEVDCAGRTAGYTAWYELYPSYPVYFKSPVRPGDNFTGSVTYSGALFTIKLTDNTAGWNQTYTQPLASAVRSSAEVIAEAPSSGGGGVLPLTNFGTVNFTGATVNGTTGLCHASGVTEITMPSVSVSSLACPGNTFSVGYTGGGGGWPPWPWF